MNPWAFGLDLAGYSSGRSALAAARIVDGRAEVVLLDDVSLSRPVRGDALITAVQDAEVALLDACLSRGPLAVDVPIDLQGLGETRQVSRVWELTQRPADRVFGGLPPLADRIGSTVARFAAIRSRLAHAEPLGERLFETYPAATLELMGLPRTGYKPGRCVATDGGWVSANLNSRKGDRAFSDLLSLMAVDATIDLSDDDLDAAICALTVASPAKNRLEGADLAHHIQAAVGPPGNGPRGYTLLISLPVRGLVITRSNAREWFTRHN